MEKQMINRLIAGIVMIPIFLTPIILGHWVLVLGLVYVVIQGLKEYFFVVKENEALYKISGYIIGIAFIVFTYINPNTTNTVITVSALGFLPLRLIDKNFTFSRWLKTFLGALYIGLLLSYVILLRELPNGTEWLITIFLGGSSTDVFSYVTGKLFGKTKLAPRTSPGKTWEGFVGGMIMSVLFVVISTYIFNLTNIFTGIMLGVVISIVDLIGDLFASMVKRTYGAKDFGAWIMKDAHGGILDRIDGWLLVFPVMYMILVTFFY